MISTTDKIDTLRAMIASKRTWLETFSEGRKKRPDFEIETKRREVDVLRAILADYEGQPG